MKILILSDCRLPTNLDYPGHGLGRSIARIAIGLAARGHDVTVCGGFNSDVPGCTMRIDANEDQRAYAMAAKPIDCDVLLDGSHHFGLATLRPDVPAACKVADGEGQAPRNRVYGHPNIPLNYGFPVGVVVCEGVDVDAIPFVPDGRNNHLLFASAMWPVKKPEVAVAVAKKAGVPIWLMGYGTPLDLPADTQLPAKSGAEFYAELARARGMIYPMASLAQLEAAATGTPSICMLATDIWLEEGVTGFIREDVEEAAEVVPLLDGLDRKKIRQWVADCRSVTVMAEQWERVLQRVANGETW
jgi:glycosyltransferase involved in cell wall biosynthesis